MQKYVVISVLEINHSTDKLSFQALVSSMLDVDAKKRPTALQLCKHPWFSNIDNLPNVKLSNIQDYNLVRVCIHILSFHQCLLKSFGLSLSSIILMLHLMQ